jgi:hypothetical protein
MQELLAKDDIPKESQKVPQFNQGINPNKTINMDYFSQSFGPNNPLLHLAFVNFRNFYNTCESQHKSNTSSNQHMSNTCNNNNS